MAPQKPWAWKSFKESLADPKYASFLPDLLMLGDDPYRIFEYYNSKDNSIDAFSDALMALEIYKPAFRVPKLKLAHTRILWKRLAEWNARLCPCGFYMQKCKDHRCDEYHCPNVFCNWCPCNKDAYDEIPPSRRWLFVVFLMLSFDCGDEERPRQFAPRESNDQFDISIGKFMRDPSPDKPCLCRFFLENICYFLTDLDKIPGLKTMQQHQGVMCSLVSYVKARFAHRRWPNQERDLAEFVKLLHIYRN